MSHPAPYKPSPLSYGSPRTSPFRRPESPASPFRRPESPSSPSPTTIRPTTPTPLASPTKSLQSPSLMYQTPLTSPSKLQTPTTPTSETTSWTPRGLTPSLQPSTHPPQTSPTRTSSAATAIPTHKAAPIDPISALPPTQLHLLRSSFQLLDHDNDGLLTRPDISTALKNLGQPSDPSSLLPFFPPGAPQSVPLPSYLTTLSTLLAPLSSTPELLNAFAAFDDHDTGEIDVGELRDAVLHTAPEAGGRGLSEGEVEEALRGFVGKRAFGREMAKGGGGRGEVFRYREWVGGVMGGGEEKGEGEK